MGKVFSRFRNSLVSKLILIVGIVLVVSMSIWAYFNIDYQKRELMDNIISGTERLTNTIRLGAHYAMMLNSRDDINQIIQNIGKQPEIENIRIYNKEGQIKFSNSSREVDSITNIKAEACDICHRTEPPLITLRLDERIRIFQSGDGRRRLGIITPIRNEPGCATGDCHFHPEGKKILGALDVVVSLDETDQEILKAEKGIVGLSAFMFMVTSTIIFVFLFRFVNRPIKKMIEETERISIGDYSAKVAVDQPDEMGKLAHAINRMGDEINKKQTELSMQRDEYQELFEHVPCLITVQNRNFELISYNREFSEIFDPREGDYCFHAYKGRDEKCVNCPVEKTFSDGQSHYTEESGINKDGSPAHWLVRTSPIRDADGNVIAAMEINLDITARRQLEVELKKSEKKYHSFFSNIPNPVFVLDTESLTILDCNESVTPVYGYAPGEIIGQPFSNLFVEEERMLYDARIRHADVINQVRHLKKDGAAIFVNIRISPSENSDRQVLLVTTSDITKRLETEQQLIQASKMATLGEMATGVAHELNQPLSVIKTASSFFIKKLNQNEPIDDTILSAMLGKIDGNVDRATNIINHMRQFARKSDLEQQKIQLSDVLESAFEIFSQQLKVRGIEVDRDIEPGLPRIKADPSRLEQVFINLLLNARDAIEEKWSTAPPGDHDKKITIKTRFDGQFVVCMVCDTGIGLPRELTNRVFEPFFTTKEVGKGTGLGLSISYGIVKECGGEIETAPNDGQGTCFIVKFPASQDNNDIDR
jgi:PAS domain S-box-containing protein